MQDWTTKYAAIPYRKGGLDEVGVDCWGLARMIYRDHLGVELPAFADAAQGESLDMAAEIAAQGRESWSRVEEVKPFDIVLLRVDGAEKHLGVVVQPGEMIHAMDKVGVVVERYDTGRWKHRVSGVYRYTPESVALVGCPHPLRTTRIDATAIPGETLASMIHRAMRAAGWQNPEKIRGAAWVNGQQVPMDEWAEHRPAPGSRVEFRIVPGSGSLGRTLGMIAVMAVAIAVSIWVPTLLPGTATLLGMGGAAWGAIAGAAVGLVGGLLVNAIFPVRLPSLPTGNSPGTPKGQNLLRGAHNQANQYGAIPVILGRMRYNPPLAANTYADIGTTVAYQRMALCWGYGPLQISDIRVGDAQIATLRECEVETVPGESGQSMTRFNSLYGKDVVQEQIGLELVNIGGAEVNWVTTVISKDVDRITLTFHFPEGLRAIARTGSSTGNVWTQGCALDVQIRQLNSDTLAPITPFGDVHRNSVAENFTLPPAFYQLDSDEELEPVYQWHRVSLDEYCKVIIRDGAVTTSPGSNPSGSLLARLQADSFGVTDVFSRLPATGTGEEHLYDICVYGNGVYQIIDRRTVDVAGCQIYHDGRNFYIAPGTVSRADRTAVGLGWSNQPYSKRKNAFSYSITFKVAKGIYEVRARRRDDSRADQYRSGTWLNCYHKCIFLAATGYAYTRPINQPKPLAMTALRVRATDQINGTLEAVSGTCTSICLDYDRTTGTWISRPTRNPASLFRHVLQHPGNAQRVPDSEIDLVALQVWHDYCRVNGFMFDAILVDQEPLLDTLRDICAAGRSSPTKVDGKWTVVTDKPRTSIAQHITPHNSWGFEGVRALPKIPHAFRVTFQNSLRGYQDDELIVYNDGYGPSNATLIEGLVLPGVTTPAAVYKHARFHLAQLKLRPETYTVNMDVEHLICTRGDLVRVTHDVPLWGVGSGRIKTYVSGTVLELDEAMPMDAGKQYTIRIRLEDGSSITRTVAAKAEDGHYTSITLTSSLTSTQGKPGNLFMFGDLSEESIECIVQAIEPMNNLTARLTLVDYSPAIYASDTETIPAWESQITSPPNITARAISARPVLASFQSDESAMVKVGPGQFGYTVIVGWRSPSGLPPEINGVEVQMDYIGDGEPIEWGFAKTGLLGAGAVTFSDVEEGESYIFRARYVTKDGRTGPWSATAAHTIIGKTTNPGTVTGFTAEAEGTKIRLSWTENPEIDIARYEVRAADSDWGLSGYLYRGADSTCLVNPPAYLGTGTWYIKAIDTGGRYSEAATAVSSSYEAIPNITAISEVFADTSLTNATVTLDWDDVAPVFGLKSYRVSYGSAVKWVTASTITLPADWLGSRAFTVQAQDMRGNLSSGYTKAITKLAPNPVTNLRAQVIDNNVLLFWNLPAKTTLPVQDVIVKKGNDWASASVIGTKSGAFTSLQELVGGTYKYWVAVRDTDNHQSTPVSVTAKVSSPPDFVFFAQYESTLAGTYSGAVQEPAGAILPVNTTETWEQHFASRGWDSPQDQINAGFPVFIQPTTSSGHYEEVIDYGTVLASSKIAVWLDGDIVAGNPVNSITISTSPDNVTWTEYPDSDAIYATDFRYFKVRAEANGVDGTGIYRFHAFSATLDAKLKNDAGTITANAGDATGTWVPFNVEFIDITSLGANPGGTTSLSCVIDFDDVPRPTGFRVYLFDSATGNRATGTVYWSAKGY